MKCPNCQSEIHADTRFCSQCGAALPPSGESGVVQTKTLQEQKEELTTGSYFAGRYQIIEELGKGGMGRVYRALDKELDEEVALKLIKPEIASDKNTIERFHNELKLARKISHRNVGRMYELMEEKGTRFITMEYVAGENLKSTIRRIGQLPVGKSIAIAKQICEGLSEAHRLGIVHRDLKPNNIMLDKEGQARILDFGIARSLKAKGITGQGVMIGTPEYMSPEQVEGKDVDHRSDIYSLGIILYEMLTSRVPFEADTPFAVGVKQKSEIPKPPKTLNTQIPEDLNTVILKCLEKDEEKRFQNVQALLSELNRIEEGIPTTEREVSKRKSITSREITVSFGPKKLIVPGLAVVALAVAAMIVLKVIHKKEAFSPPSAKPSVAVLSFNDLSPEKDQEYLCLGLAESLINALTKIQDLRVPATTSAFLFGPENQNMMEIGEKLGVDAVLRGSVQKIGNMVRITAQIINVKDETLRWSEQYNRELDDVFTIQDEISMAIVSELKVNLLGEERKELLKHYTENAEIYELYLKGRYFMRDRSREGLEKALDYFNKALEMDSNYALGYVGLSDCYNFFAFYDFFPREEVFPKAKEAALKALAIDESLAEAHASLGWIGIQEWNWDEAEREFKRAVELNPGYVSAHHWFSMLYMYLAKYDLAVREIDLALELDPLSPLINRDAGGVYFFAGQYDRSIQACRKALELDPNSEWASFYLAMAHLEKSMYTDALAGFKGQPFWEHAIYARMGEKQRAREWIGKHPEELFLHHPIWIAFYYGEAGDVDQVFLWLDKAYDSRDMYIVALNSEFFLPQYKSDSRYQALLKKIGLVK